MCTAPTSNSGRKTSSTLIREELFLFQLSKQTNASFPYWESTEFNNRMAVTPTPSLLYFLNILYFFIRIMKRSRNEKLVGQFVLQGEISRGVSHEITTFTAA